MSSRAFTLSLLLWCTSTLLGSAADFVLSAPGLNRSSQARLTERELRIVDHQGRETFYAREPSVDTADGLFIAYRNPTTGQVVRWPASNQGPMQIGTPSGATWTFRTSQMQVIPRGGLGTAPATDTAVLPPNTTPNTFPRAGSPRPPVPRDPVPRDSVPPGFLPGGSAPGSRLGNGHVGDSNDFFAQLWQQRQPAPKLMRLSMRDDRGREWYLGQRGRNRLAMLADPGVNVSDWFVVPAGRGYVRVQPMSGVDWLSLAVTPTRSLTIEQVSQDPGQLWRVLQTNAGVLGAASTGYWLESALAPGFVLSGLNNGQVNLLPINGSYGQVWLPQEIALASDYEPLWRTVNHEVRANQALPPAQIDLVNSHNQALRILIADRRTSGIRQVRLEAGAKATGQFDRDAGATIVETYEIRGTGGVWNRQQFVTEIPPASLYDLSVYEEFLQSIAIDRTGTSPDPIEDINYQPKSVGWLPLPAGRALPDVGQIDAYAEAQAAGNPGAVRRLDPRSLEKASSQPDPLESILEESTRPSVPRNPPPRQKF